MTIRKSIKVERSPEISFKVFCDEIGQWWPIQQGFAFGGERTRDLVMEGRVGGRFYELYADGTEFEIGRVTAYQPPAIVAFTWRAPSWDVATHVRVMTAAGTSCSGTIKPAPVQPHELCGGAHEN